MDELTADGVRAIVHEGAEVHPPAHGMVRTVGSNHGGMRQFNERIVLQTIRLHGALPKAEVARLTHLSNQTASVIINKLLDEGLLLRQERLRGKVGQPSIPIALNPDGAYTLGIKIGRRSLDVLALDFVGQVRHRESLSYDYPRPSVVFAAIEERLHKIRLAMGPAGAQRLVGVGVASPFMLDGWTDLLGIEIPADQESWAQVDIPQRIAQMTDLPIEYAKDTTAACVAELVAGQGRSLPTFLYLFIGTFIGGGLVIDSHLYPGHSGNAGAVGSYPLGVASGGQSPSQLLSQASSLTLERALEKRGYPYQAAHDARAMEPQVWDVTQEWLKQVCPAIAMSVVGSTAILELNGVIIDGALDRGLLAHVVYGVNTAMDQYNWEGLHRPTVTSGTVGPDAHVMGGAILPLYAHFAPDRTIFLKQ